MFTKTGYSMKSAVRRFGNYIFFSHSIDMEALKFQWRALVEMAPIPLKKKLQEVWEIPQNETHHPEGDVGPHTQIVTMRLMLTGNMNLIIAGFMHDLFKGDVFAINPKTGLPTAYGHEKPAADACREFSDWIETMGADPEIVYHIVYNHMRVKNITQMRRAKVERMKREIWWQDLVDFTQADSMVPGRVGHNMM